MKKKEEIKQLDKLWLNMKNHIKAFSISGKQEELHQFRVQVKKLKAMLTLYSCEPENKGLLKDFKPVKRVFKEAGDIRNAHINLELGGKHHLNDENFSHHQQQTLDKGIEAFKNNGSKYLKAIKKAHVILQHDIHRLHNKTIRDFYKSKLVHIDAFFAGPTFNEELHNARKNIKLLMYNQKVAAKAIKNKAQLNQDYLDGLQNSIGEWHDHNLAIKTLSNTGKTEDDAITDLKNSNAVLEKTIVEQSSNFKEKVKALTKPADKNKQNEY